MEKREWNEDEVKFVQLRVDASTLSMVAILKLERIRVKGGLSGFVTGLRREGRRNFIYQKTDVSKELCTVAID